MIFICSLVQTCFGEEFSFLFLEHQKRGGGMKTKGPSLKKKNPQKNHEKIMNQSLFFFFSVFLPENTSPISFPLFLFLFKTTFYFKSILTRTFMVSGAEESFWCFFAPDDFFQKWVGFKRFFSPLFSCFSCLR